MSIELYPSIAKIKRNGVYENLPGFVPETGSIATQQMIATSESSATAQYIHNKGEYFRLNDTLYQAIVKINVGDAIVVGTNCEVAVIGNDLTHVANSIAAYELGIATSSHNTGDYFMVGETLYVATSDIQVSDTISTSTNCRVAVVGDELSELKTALSGDESAFNYLLYSGDKASVVLEQYGYTWNTGSPTTNSAYSRTNPDNPIKNNNSVLYFNNTDYSIGLLGFREDGSYIGYAEDSWFSFDGYYIVPSTYPYFKMMFKRNDGSATTDTDRTAISKSLKVISSLLDDTLESPDLPAKSKAVGDKIAELTNSTNLLKRATLVRNAFYNGYHEASESYSYFILPITSGNTYIIGATARFIASIDSNIASNVTAGYSYTATYTGDLYVTFYNEDEAGWSVYLDTSNPANVTAYNEAITKRTDTYGCQLTDKVWYSCGDSFTEGDFTGYSGAKKFIDTPYYGMLKVYPYFIGRRTGVNVKNVAVGGMTLAVADDTNNFIQIYQNIGTDADYITMKFGINDGHKSVPIGTENSTDTSTFYGAWNTVLSWFIANRPNAKLGIIVSNGLDSNDYATATIAMAKKYGIPYLNEWSGEELPVMLRSGRTDVAQSVKEARDAQYRVSSDNQHPNPTAHEFESYIIESWLKTL